MSGSEKASSKPTPKGIPADHPSFGRPLRDPVDGPSWPQQSDHGGRMITPLIELIWGIALTIWILYSRLGFISPYFKDPDAARLAFGVGQRLQGISFSDGVFHLLEKQYGAFLLFEWLARIFGIDIASLQHFMSLTCAVLMIGILALSFHLGYMIWGRRVALVSTTILSISPMMWITGQYPTSLVPAFFFFMMAMWAMVLSYRLRGGRWWLIGSAVLFALAIIIRLDMILGLLAPICYAFFVDRRGLRRALILYLITVSLLLIFWLAVLRIPLLEIFRIDPHQPDYPKSLLMNWWGMGPFLFVFAFAGFVYRFVTDRKALPFIFFWIVGFNTFYTGHLDSPRNFISYYPVVSWLAAFSIIAFYGYLVRIVKYNRPLRLLFMVLLAFGALTMLTVSTIRDGNGRTRIAWGETISYARADGLSPTGAVWYYMQDFRQGEGFQFSWLEIGTREFAEQRLDPNSDEFIGDPPVVYVGSESQVFLNYFLLATGWKLNRVLDPFITFTRDKVDEDPTALQHLVQTVYVGETPIPALASLVNPFSSNYHIGNDALTHIIGMEDEEISPYLLVISGWHVEYSFNGLDIVVSGPMERVNDGTLECERELVKYFHTDPLPRYHINLFPSDSPEPESTNILISYDGNESTERAVDFLKDVSEISWTSNPHPDRWLALVINREGLLPEYSLSINGQLVEDAEWVARNLAGFITSRWDIIMVPPKYLDSNGCEFKIEADIRGSIFDIYWVQRTYPDCQFRAEIARPLGLEFADYPCER